MAHTRKTLAEKRAICDELNRPGSVAQGLADWYRQGGGTPPPAVREALTGLTKAGRRAMTSPAARAAIQRINESS